MAPTMTTATVTAVTVRSMAMAMVAKLIARSRTIAQVSSGEIRRSNGTYGFNDAIMTGGGVSV